MMFRCLWLPIWIGDPEGSIVADQPGHHTFVPHRRRA